MLANQTNNIDPVVVQTGCCNRALGAAPMQTQVETMSRWMPYTERVATDQRQAEASWVAVGRAFR